MIVVYIPTGFFKGYQAWRKNLSGDRQRRPFPVFWDVSKSLEMLAYACIRRRVLATIPVVLMVALFVFSLLYIAPGDPAAIIAGDQATPEDVERIRASLGLDRPFLVRFGEWLWQVLHGDLGTSIFTNLPVTPHDRAADRADGVADGADPDPVAERRHSDGRDRGLEARHAGSTGW